MREVAQAAGVSLKTVSRVVNGEPGVGLATARVRQAIEALGFHRNEIARSLRPAQASATVGLVIGDVSNPFYSAIARAVEGVASAHRHMLITASSEDELDLERELVHTMSRHRVDGLSTGSPTAHRRIGVVGGAPSFSTVRERLEGYRLVLADAGLQFEDSLVRLSQHDAAEAESVAGALLEQSDPPTAIFATNNRMSIGVLRALRARGQRVALVGFDDFELADMLATPITVVAHDPSEMGRLAAELLFARLAGDADPPKRLVLPTTLVVRGSGEIGP